MGKHPEVENLGSAEPTFDQLKQRVVTSNNETVRQVASDILIEKALHGDSWMDVVNAVQVGCLALSASRPHGKTQGAQILNAVGEYFTHLDELTFRYMLPGETRESQYASKQDTMQRRTKETRTLLTNLPSLLQGRSIQADVSQDFLHEVIGALNTIDDGLTYSTTSLMMPLAKSSHLAEAASNQGYTQVFGHYFQGLSEANNRVFLRRDIDIFPVTFLDSRQTVPTDVPHFPTIFEKRCNGISLNDLLEEEDTEKLADQMVAYMGGIPKNDVILQVVIPSLLFTPATNINASDVNRYYGNYAQFAQRLFEAQHIITQRLFLEGEQGTQSQQDEQLTQVLDNLYDDTLDRFAIMISTSAIVYIFNRMAFYPEADLTEILYQDPLLTRYESFIPRTHRVATLQDLKKSLYIHEWPQVRDRWKERFSQSKSLQKLTDYVELQLVQDFSEFESAHVMNLLEEKRGAEFMKKLEEDCEEFEEVSLAMWQDAMTKLNYWPHENSRVIVKFKNDSLPNGVGLESVQFFFNSPGEPIVIAFTQDDGKVMVCELSGDGQFSHQTHPGVSDGVTAMLHLFAVSRLKDIVTRNELQGKKRLPRVVFDEPRSEETSSDQKSQESSETYLPRSSRRSQEEPADTDIEIVDSSDVEIIEDLQGELEQSDKAYKKRFVDAYRKQLKGGDRLAAIWLEIHSLPDDQVPTDAQLQELEAAALAMKEQPKKKKRKEIEGMPPKMQDRLCPTKVGNQTIYAYTWVIGYDSPRPLPEELISPKNMYERHYRTSARSGSHYVDGYVSAKLTMDLQTEQEENNK